MIKCVMLMGGPYAGKMPGVDEHTIRMGCFFTNGNMYSADASRLTGDVQLYVIDSIEVKSDGERVVFARWQHFIRSPLSELFHAYALWAKGGSR